MGTMAKMQGCRGKREMGMALTFPRRKLFKAAGKKMWSAGRGASGLEHVCVLAICGHSCRPNNGLHFQFRSSNLFKYTQCM